MAFEDHVDIWHDEERCFDDCGNKTNSLDRDGPHRVRCCRHSTCGCRSDRPKQSEHVRKPWFCNRVRLCDPRTRPRITGLWRTCRQLHAETIRQLYSNPVFSFNGVRTFERWTATRERNNIACGIDQQAAMRGQVHFIQSIELPETSRPTRLLRQLPKLQTLYVDNALTYEKSQSGHVEKATLINFLNTLSQRIVYCTNHQRGYQDRKAFFSARATHWRVSSSETGNSLSPRLPSRCPATGFEWERGGLLPVGS